MFKKIDSIVTRIFWVIAIFSFTSLFVLVAAQVLSRLLRIQNLAPPDEIITLMFVWFVYIGATLIFREHTHLRVELLDGFFEKTARRKAWYRIFIATIQGLFLVVLWDSSMSLFLTAGERRSPMLSLPQRYWYLPLLISTFCMFLYCIWDIVLSVVDLREEKSK